MSLRALRILSAAFLLGFLVALYVIPTDVTALIYLLATNPAALVR